MIRVRNRVNFLAEFNRIEFSFPSPKPVTESRFWSRLSNYLLIAGRRITGFIPFPNANSLVQD